MNIQDWPKIVSKVIATGIKPSGSPALIPVSEDGSSAVVSISGGTPGAQENEEDLVNGTSVYGLMADPATPPTIGVAAKARAFLLDLYGRLQVLQANLNHLYDNVRVAGYAVAASLGQSGFLSQAVTNTAATIKASSGNLYSLDVINPHSASIYVKLYDATSPTVGTTVPILIYEVAATSRLHIPANVMPLAHFNNAIKVAAVTGLANSDATAPGSVATVQAQYA